MSIDLKALGSAAITLLDATYDGAKSVPLEDRIEKFCNAMPSPGLFEAGFEGHYKESLGVKEAETLAHLLVATIAIIPHLRGDAIETFGKVAARDALDLVSEGKK